LGSGASAKVYSATYEPRQCLVALKRIDLESIRMPCAQFEALYNEVQIMSLCQHPHVLPILSSFVSGSHLYIVTPNMAAGSCMDILHRERPLGFPEPVVACIMKQALLGLVYLHENGLIHRDVKAANLLVDACGKIKLADFGVSGQLMQGMSQRHSFVGSPCWLAPEVLLQRGYDAKVDLWSLGITCVELMRGRPPFHDARDAYAVFEHILHDPPPLGMMPQVSDQCHDFIRRCLRKRPHKRWTAREALGHPWILEAPAPDAFASLLTETGTVHTSQGKKNQFDS
ncbi:kinase-like domain-containing protein, partial [Gongronella butleri]